MVLRTIHARIKEEQLRAKALYYSIMDGMAHSVMTGFGNNIISAFAVYLRASNSQIGLISTLPVFLGAIVQLAGVKLLEIFRNRLKLVLTFALLHALLWLPIAAIPFAVKQDQAWILLIFYCLSVMSTSVTIPIWTSMMGDLVWLRERGKYFGKRNAWVGAVLLSSTIIAGYFLSLYHESLLFYGFATSFSIAFLYRLISWYYLGKMHEPRHVFETQRQPSLLEFVRKIRSNNYGSFVLFVGFTHFSVAIAGPFFAPYMLSELGFSYFQYSAVIAAAALSQVLFMTRWGKNADRFGNVKILTLTSILVSAIPMLWLFTQDFYLILLINVFAGMAWAGFNLSSSNFIFDSVETPKRVRYIAYYNIIVSSLALVGGMLGGFYLTQIGDKLLFSSLYHVVFFFSGTSRLLFGAILLQKIREVRNVPGISGGKLFFSLFELPSMEFFQEQVFEMVMLPKKIASSIKGKIRKRVKGKRKNQ